MSSTAQQHLLLRRSTPADHQVIITTTITTCHRRGGGGGILIVIWAIKHTTLYYLQCQCIKPIVLIEIDIINTANNNNEGVIPEINTAAAEKERKISPRVRKKGKFSGSRRYWKSLVTHEHINSVD